MGRFREELRNPWGLLLGATAGGAAWVVSAHPVAAGVVGVAAWLSKAAIETFQRRGEPQVAAGSPEARWLARADTAARGFAELDRSLPLAAQVTDTMAVIHRLAGQATRAGRTLAGFDLAFLMAEQARLAREREHATPEVAVELERSMASLTTQHEVYDRLHAARVRVLARLESSTLGLESLLARAVELSALSAAGPLEGAAALDELSDVLEGIRRGMAELEEITRRTLDR
ncbi:hypothetical protein [Streptosporangium sp. KLBMP 9127]|nr:hypothetical protein [Streptosporangium sp. KLBMP 9127]